MWAWIPKLDELRRAGTPVVLVTVARTTGSTPRAPGAKMLVTADAFFGTIGGGRLEELAIADGRTLLANGAAAATLRRFPLAASAGQCCGGMAELLMEPLGTGPRLWLFGAGHVAQALCRTLVGTPFAVHVVDERPEWLLQVPDGIVRHDEPWDDALAAAPLDDALSYAVVMTHRHDLDEEIVFALTKRPLRWMGLIGSKAKWERFRTRLEGRGVTKELLDRVRCPVGLDLGGKAPQEVAVSVAAELLKTFYGK